jgi:hypothetical protein
MNSRSQNLSCSVFYGCGRKEMQGTPRRQDYLEGGKITTGLKLRASSTDMPA